MKESIAYSQDATAIKHHVCSKKTCITCFENRGCMYEQYLIAATYNIEVSDLAKQNEDRNSAKSTHIPIALPTGRQVSGPSDTRL